MSLRIIFAGSVLLPRNTFPSEGVALCQCHGTETDASITTVIGLILHGMLCFINVYNTKAKFQVMKSSLVA